MACFCKRGLGPVHDIHKGLQYLSETITELKQKITSELIPHKIKDIIEDINKLVQAIHKIVGHIEQDSVYSSQPRQRKPHPRVSHFQENYGSLIAYCGPNTL